MMRARAKMKPGQQGTKKLTRKYGDRLICVRYRYDAQCRRRYKTAELVVDEAPWEPRPTDTVWIQVDYEEKLLRRCVREVGGRWDAERGLWQLTYSAVRLLSLEDRLAEGPF